MVAHDRRGARCRRRALFAVALLALATAGARPAAAGRLTDFSQEELHSLSQLCLSQRFINEELDAPAVPEPERAHEQLEAKFGHSFIHYHHYCWAVLYARRAERLAAESRFNYGRVVDNLDYVIRNSDPDFALLPDVYVQKGEALDELERRAEAEAAYRNAIHAKVDYVPAYVALAQHYIEARDVDAARRTIEEGLKYDPSSKTLAEKKAALAKLENAPN